jgi:hypothetical protein
MAYIGKQPVVGNFQVCDAITVVNGQAAYTMQVSSANVEPENANHMLVSLNGILQKPGSSFTISGSTITFASNLATGDVIDFIILLGNVLDIGTPSDDSVGAAQIKDDLISGTTALATAPADTDEFLVSDAGTLKRIDYSLIKGGGKILQSISAVVSAASGTSTIPFDNTDPAVGEGTEIFSQNLTPASSSNKVRIHGVIQAGAAGQDTSNGFGVSIFRDSTLVGIYAFMDWTAYTEGSYCFPINIIDSPSSTSAIDYSVRVGNLYRSSHNTTTWYVGQLSTSSIFNGKSALNTIELNEISG